MAQQKQTVPVKIAVPPVIAASEVGQANEMEKDEETGKWSVTGQRKTKDGVPLWQIEVMLPGKQFGRAVLEKVTVTFAAHQMPEITPGHVILLDQPQGRIASVTAEGIAEVSADGIINADTGEDTSTTHRSA